ncbi:MAG: phospholipid carrier-dependent glycosyltransferase [Sphingomonadaceae bacterium]
MNEPAAELRRNGAILLALVAALAGWLCFARLDEPRAPVWDEAYYLTSTARYHQGLTQFSSHPPLGTMLIAAGDMASGRNAHADWRTIGAEKKISAEAIPAGFDYAGPRLAPALFGTLAALLFAALMLELTGSALAAGLLSLLLLADTALLVQFRSAQLDAFQLGFVLAGLLAAVRAHRRQRTRDYFLFGLFIALAALVRANALVLGAMAPLLLWPLLCERDWRGLAARCAAGLAGGMLAAVLVLAAWIQLTPNMPDPATPAGRQDQAFVSGAHRRALETGEWNLSAAINAAVDIERFMANDLAITPPSDANGSHPWQWLAGQGAILYRSDRSSGRQLSIGLVPNLAAWLISLLGVLTSLLPGRLREDRLRAALLAGWVANMAALQWLDTQRVLYSYHYFIPLLLGHCLAALEWKRHGLPRRIALAVALPVVLFGVAAWPLATFGTTPGWLCHVRP